MQGIGIVYSIRDREERGKKGGWREGRRERKERGGMEGETGFNLYITACVCIVKGCLNVFIHVYIYMSVS